MKKKTCLIFFDIGLVIKYNRTERGSLFIKNYQTQEDKI